MNKVDIGTVFAGRYQIKRLLGRGGFSEVWLAVDNMTGLRVALKIYAPGTGLDEEGMKLFSAEFSLVFNLNHSNLLRPSYYDCWERQPYLVLSYCEQGSALKLVGNISEKDAWRFLYDVAAGLEYLHAKEPPIIHQDIKPENVLMETSGTFMITDFGISTKIRSTLRKSIIQTESSGGTTAYMGPERFGKKPAPIMASDIWSLGATLFELLTGDTPFGDLGGVLQKNGAEVPDIEGNYSEGLKQVVELCLSKETWDRPSAAKLKKLADCWLRGEEGEQADIKQKSENRQTVRFDTAADKGINVRWAAFATLEQRQVIKQLIDNFVWVEGSAFLMGENTNGAEKLHEVRVDDYYIGKYEITQKEWQYVMGHNPSFYQGDSLPVEQVSWEDCQEFIQRLNELTGLNFRLPTEAQWEYAARGGIKSQKNRYSGSNELEDVGWYNENAYSQTQEVGQKLPNEVGLYDMSGNVWEWCEDWYGSYASDSINNPTGPASGTYRVFRGGSWCFGEHYCQVAFRNYNVPTYKRHDLGLRLVLLF